MRPLFLALVPAGVALAVLAYEVQVDSLHSPDDRAVAQVAVGLSFLLAGLVAWWRRPLSPRANPSASEPKRLLIPR